MNFVYIPMVALAWTQSFQALRAQAMTTPHTSASGIAIGSTLRAPRSATNDCATIIVPPIPRTRPTTVKSAWWDTRFVFPARGRRAPCREAATG